MGCGSARPETPVLARGTDRRFRADRGPQWRVSADRLRASGWMRAGSPVTPFTSTAVPSFDAVDPAAYRAINPRGVVLALVLENGTAITSNIDPRSMHQTSGPLDPF